MPNLQRINDTWRKDYAEELVGWRQPLHLNSTRHSRRRNFTMTDSLVDHGLPPLQPHKGQPSCLFLGLRLPLSITEIFGLERRLEHPYVLFQNNSHCEIKVIEEKQHVKYPVQYVLRSLRRTKGIMIVNKGDRVKVGFCL